MPSSERHRRWLRALLRHALSYYVCNGLAAAIGLLLVSAAAHLALGAAAGAAAAVGVIVCIPPDQAAPRRGKFWQLLPAALLGPPLFLAVQWLRAAPLELGLLLVPASFCAFLAGAWGRRGLPISVSMMFALIFSMALPGEPKPGAALGATLHFMLGEALYLVWATLANAALNARYRRLMLADSLLALARLMRTQAAQFMPVTAAAGEPLIARQLLEQAALADQVQAARNILLESPRTAPRQRLAAMLLQLLEMRDHLLACELDLDLLKSSPGHAPALADLHRALLALALEVEALADALLLGRLPARAVSHRPRLAALRGSGDADSETGATGPTPDTLVRGLAHRVGHVDDEVQRLISLARHELAPDLAGVRAAWQMFVSPTAWSWQPLATLWRWDAPPLRHALRAALAIATAYAVALALPWGSHDYWILLTIVVVLRGSLAQTLERRNTRVAGTLVGCILVGALLSAHPALPVLWCMVTLAQALAHAFAVRRYAVTVVSATVLALVQAHMLAGGTSPVFEMAERMADTLIGVAIAWAFSYVLPSWERGQIPTLVARALAAQARHARLALGLGQLAAVDDEPELAWRLARREAYDTLSALVQATQRSLFEPRAVRPPLAELGRLLAHSYQLLAQLTAVKTLLRLRRGQLQLDRIGPPLQQAAEAIAAALQPAPGSRVDAPATSSDSDAQGPVALPDPFEQDLSPWVLRRLDLACGLSVQVQDDAAQVLRAPEAAAAGMQAASTPAP